MIEWLLFDIPAACMAEAAQRNAIPVEVLYAIRHQERGQLGLSLSSLIFQRKVLIL